MLLYVFFKLDWNLFRYFYIRSIHSRVRLGIFNTLYIIIFKIRVWLKKTFRCGAAIAQRSVDNFILAYPKIQNIINLKRVRFYCFSKLNLYTLKQKMILLSYLYLANYVSSDNIHKKRKKIVTVRELKIFK